MLCKTIEQTPPGSYTYRFYGKSLDPVGAGAGRGSLLRPGWGCRQGSGPPPRTEQAPPPTTSPLPPLLASAPSQNTYTCQTDRYALFLGHDQSSPYARLIFSVLTKFDASNS